MLTKNKYFIFSLLSLFAVYFLFGLTNFSFVDTFRNEFENSIVDPLSYAILFSAGISFFLLFFSEKIFQLWLRRIVVWFLPVSFIWIWSSSGSNSIISPSQTDIAILSGGILVVITLLFALVQYFYYKR